MHSRLLAIVALCAAGLLCTIDLSASRIAHVSEYLSFDGVFLCIGGLFEIELFPFKFRRLTSDVDIAHMYIVDNPLTVVYVFQNTRIKSVTDGVIEQILCTSDQITGLALDERNQNLYWSHESSIQVMNLPLIDLHQPSQHGKQVEIYNVNGNREMRVDGRVDTRDMMLEVYGPGVMITDIVLDSSGGAGYIFWLEKGIECYRIMRSSLSGDDVTALHSCGLLHPKSLTIDRTGSLLFWYDFVQKTLYSTDYHGNRIMNVKTTESQILSLTITTERKLVWYEERHLKELDLTCLCHECTFLNYGWAVKRLIKQMHLVDKNNAFAPLPCDVSDCDGVCIPSEQEIANKCLTNSTISSRQEKVHAMQCAVQCNNFTTTTTTTSSTTIPSTSTTTITAIPTTSTTSTTTTAASSTTSAAPRSRAPTSTHSSTSTPSTIVSSRTTHDTTTIYPKPVQPGVATTTARYTSSNQPHTSFRVPTTVPPSPDAQALHDASDNHTCNHCYLVPYCVVPGVVCVVVAATVCVVRAVKRRRQTHRYVEVPQFDTDLEMELPPRSRIRQLIPCIRDTST